MGTTGTGPAYLLHLRLFLEGIEVPVIGASVTANLNAPATATIQVVPSDKLTTLLARTTVHLFYLDSAEFRRSGLAQPNEHHYKLLFCGEVFDMNFGRSGSGSRSVTLTCLDFSNVWDTNYSYIMRYAVGAQEDPSGGVLHNLSGFVGDNVNPFDDIVNDPAQVIRQMSLSSGAGNPALPGNGTILGGLLSILELLSGVQGLFLGINPWATIEERRCRVLDSIVSDNGVTAASLFNQQTFADWLQQRTGNYGSVISFRQIVGMICQYIYYDVVTNVTPAYVSGNDGKGNPGRAKLKFKIGTKDSEDTTASDNVSTAELVNDLTALTSVPQSKVAGIDSAFWAYCVRVMEKLNELLDGVTYDHGWEDSGKQITFIMSSGFRNLADTNRIRASMGKDPVDESYAATNAHMKGFAIDLTDPGLTDGKHGNMPWKLPGYSAPARPEGLPVPLDIPNSNVVIRFRKALWWFHENEGQSFSTFDALVEAIRNNPFILSSCFGYESPESEADLIGLDMSAEEEELDKYAAVMKNHVQFYKIYGQAVQAVNSEAPGGVTASWGGAWLKPADPLWGLFGLGCDPVHIQHSNFRNLTASPIGGGTAPVSVTATLLPGQTREQLKSFIFRPNIWFSPPPKCNVIYPHMFESLSVTRQMLRETTRLQLSTFNQFYESVILNNYFFAPSFPDGNHIVNEGLGSVTKTIIMDHEVFTGIIPKMEKISEISFYAKQSGETSDLKTEYAAGTASDMQSAAASAEGSTITSYGSKVAHFNLLTHRYSARQGGVQGPFNPNLVCGFPAAIIQEVPPTTERDLIEIKNGNRVESVNNKVAWLGMITSLTHTYDQGGARTQAQLSYVRSHRTGDDTDDLLSESVTDQGNFTVQDKLYVPGSAGGASTSHDFAVGSVVFKAIDFEDPAASATHWAYQILSKIVEKSSLLELLESAVQVKIGVPPTFNPYGDQPPPPATAIDTLSVYEESTALTPSADFSTANTEQDITGVKYGGQPVKSAVWTGAPTWVSIRYVAKQPFYDISSMIQGFDSGLSEIMVLPAVSAVEIASVLNTVKDNGSLAAFVHTKNTNEAIDVTPNAPVSYPPVVDKVDILIQLPGSKLEVVVASTGSIGGRNATIPVEEAIRPPWIDKNVYSAEVSDDEPTQSKICKLYNHLFHSPSVINELLAVEATPYDGMQVHSVEQAVDYLIASASTMKELANTYAGAQTSRKVASMMDVLAPKGYLPTETSDGGYFWKKSDTADVEFMNEDSLQVSGGFHSNAVTGYSYAQEPDQSQMTLAGLKFGSQLEFLDLSSPLGSRLQPDAKASIAGEGVSIRMDPRAPRAFRVKKYVDDIGGVTALRHTAQAGTNFIKTPKGKGKLG